MNKATCQNNKEIDLLVSVS